MGKIIAIGGGELGELATLSIDKEVVALTGKKNPNALFIPTASHDAEGYCETFKKVYGDMLGCKTNNLLLTDDSLTKLQITKKIKSADLIYVGGGNTQFLLELWKKRGVDVLLFNAYERGVVLSGLSAGANCWFSFGLSDYRTFDNDMEKNTYAKLPALGFMDISICPHFLREPLRKNEFVRMMQKTSGIGIALDDNCALEIVDEKYRIISAKNGASAYKIWTSKGVDHFLTMNPSANFHRIANLMKT